MIIDCYISESCSSEEALRENVMEAAELEAVDASVNFRIISETEAERLGLMGSPSILINGKDIISASEEAGG
jgi:hypothetical protein